MEELIERNGTGMWMREIEKEPKGFDASLEWLMERITTCEEEMEIGKKTMK